MSGWNSNQPLAIGVHSSRLCGPVVWLCIKQLQLYFMSLLLPRNALRHWSLLIKRPCLSASWWLSCSSVGIGPSGSKIMSLLVANNIFPSVDLALFFCSDYIRYLFKSGWFGSVLEMESIAGTRWQIRGTENGGKTNQHWSRRSLQNYPKVSSGRASYQEN